MKIYSPPYPPENGCKPSVDVLFRSASNIYGGNLIAVIMTGMGNDGAKSLRALRRDGAYIMVQDEASSVVWGMPGSAVETGYVNEIVPLNAMPDCITRIIREGSVLHGERDEA